MTELAQCQVSMQQPTVVKANTVKAKLRNDIGSVSLFSSEEKTILYEYLEKLPDGNVVCHFDFHPDNVMVSGEQWYVIDWMTGCVGDPLADVARTALILNHAEIPKAPFLVKVLARTLQRTIYQRYLREYTRLTGASILDIQKWEFPIAAARLCEWIPDGESMRLLELVKTSLYFDED